MALLVMCTFAALPTSAQIRQWYVDEQFGSDTNQGWNGWGDAFKTLQRGINEAYSWGPPNNQVLVAG